MSADRYLAAQHAAESAPWAWVIAMFAVLVVVPVAIVELDKYMRQLRRQREACEQHEIDRAIRRTQTVPVGVVDGVRAFEWADDLEIDWEVTQ